MLVRSKCTILFKVPGILKRISGIVYRVNYTAYMHAVISRSTISNIYFCSCITSIYVMHVVTLFIIVWLTFGMFYCPNSGRKLTSQGQRDMDRIAGQVCQCTK